MTALTAAVIICAYTEQRMTDIAKAVASLTRQSLPPHEIVLAIDHHDALADTCAARFGDIANLRVIRSDQPKGLSGARNAGIAASTADVVLFLDDDATADERWVEEMLAPMAADESVYVVGGRTLPAWDTARPVWFPPEFDWVVGATYRGVPLQPHDIRNPFGGNAAWRRTGLDLVGGFATGVGRVGNDAAGCEETELAIRLRQRLPQARIVFAPDATIRHRVTTDRERFGYFVTRCASEGTSKAKIAAMVGNTATSAEQAYVTKVLAPAVGRYVVAAARTRDVQPLARAGAIMVGLGATGQRYLRRRASDLLAQSRGGAR